jgi:hypothetical protein
MLPLLVQLHLVLVQNGRQADQFLIQLYGLLFLPHEIHPSLLKLTLQIGDLASQLLLKLLHI